MESKTKTGSHVFERYMTRNVRQKQEAMCCERYMENKTKTGSHIFERYMTRKVRQKQEAIFLIGI
jgi:alcohol dehydrogenase YqhD (iron-dependent ADH family)